MGSLLPSIRNNSNQEEKEEKKEEKHDERGSLEKQADSIQMVLPNIYMGSAIAAKNLDLLHSFRISHILAIGWNLTCHFPQEFEYLLLNKIEDRPGYLIIKKFKQCFDFMDDALINNNKNSNNRLFVHCHKGLSRSATVVIAYEMYKKQTDFDSVLHKIRENRSFIMPNIGFQAQLHEFKNQNYSLDMDKYQHFDVINFIQHRLPKMLERIKFNYNAYKTNPANVDEDELFELTLYTHQVHKLRQKHKLNESDIDVLTQSIQILRNIQVEFVQNESSIKRFDIMFRNKPEKVSTSPQPISSHSHLDFPSNTTKEKTNGNKIYGSIASSSMSAMDRERVLSESAKIEQEQEQEEEQEQEQEQQQEEEEEEEAVVIKTDDTKDPSPESQGFPHDPQKSESQQLIA